MTITKGSVINLDTVPPSIQSTGIATHRGLIYCQQITFLLHFFQGTPKQKRKKRKSLDGSVGTGPELIALGTTSGSVILYSVVKGDIQTVLVSQNLIDFDCSRIEMYLNHTCTVCVLILRFRKRK